MLNFLSSDEKFNGGSSLLWIVAKSDLQMKLETARCTDVYTNGGIPIPIAPNYEDIVENSIEEFERRLQEEKQEVLQRIDASSASADVKKHLSMQAEIDYKPQTLRERENMKNVKLSQFSDQEKRYDVKVKVREEKIKSFCKILQDNLGPAVLDSIRNVMSTGDCVAIWQTLCDNFESETSLTDSLHMATRTLSHIKLNPMHQLSQHFNLLDKLIAIAQQGGQAIPEHLQWQYLVNSLEDVPMYQEAIKFATALRDDITGLKTRLREVETRHFEKIHHMNIAQHNAGIHHGMITAPSVSWSAGGLSAKETVLYQTTHQPLKSNKQYLNASEKPCPACNQLGHFSKDCPNVSCDFCGKRGHTISRCWENPDSGVKKPRNYKPSNKKRGREEAEDVNPTSDRSVTLVSSFQGQTDMNSHPKNALQFAGALSNKRSSSSSD